MEDFIAARVRGIFEKANFLKHLGIQLTGIGSDTCETNLNIDDRHLQQHGFVHTGVIATLADHTAGGPRAQHQGSETSSRLNSRSIFSVLPRRAGWSVLPKCCAQARA